MADPILNGGVYVLARSSGDTHYRVVSGDAVDVRCRRAVVVIEGVSGQDRGRFFVFPTSQFSSAFRLVERPPEREAGASGR